MNSMPPKLVRVVAVAGGLSRRAAERAVLDGRVTVGGRVVRRPAHEVDQASIVQVDGTPVSTSSSSPERVRLFKFHKPAGLITTHSDPGGRTTVWDFLRERFPWMPHVVSAGRLDRESEGLLLLTNHGPMAHNLESPSRGFTREYFACVSTGRTRTISTEMLAALSAGLTLRDGTTFRPIQATVLHTDESFHRDIPTFAEKPPPLGQRWVRMQLREGKYREVRRCWQEFGFATTRLIRTAYGPFRLDALPEGAVEEVSDEDIATIDAPGAGS